VIQAYTDYLQQIAGTTWATAGDGAGMAAAIFGRRIACMPVPRRQDGGIVCFGVPVARFFGMAVTSLVALCFPTPRETV
jgi:hypothetical protein